MDKVFAPLNQAWWDFMLSMWWLWAFVLLFIALRIVQVILEERRLARSGIHDIDTMDGITFERYLEVLFIKLGYKASRTPASGDFGADLIIQKDNTRTIVQAKRYKKNVGVRAIQEVVAAQKMYQGAKTLVITNSGYTKQAQELARVNDVELWGRAELVTHILQAKKKDENKNEQHATLTK